MTTVRSCIMMEDEMNGMMNSAKIIRRRNNMASFEPTRPGVRTYDPSRYTARIPSVKRIFFLRSGILNMFANAESIKSSGLALRHELGPTAGFFYLGLGGPAERVRADVHGTRELA